MRARCRHGTVHGPGRPLWWLHMACEQIATISHSDYCVPAREGNDLANFLILAEPSDFENVHIDAPSVCEGHRFRGAPSGRQSRPAQCVMAVQLSRSIDLATADDADAPANTSNVSLPQIWTPRKRSEKPTSQRRISTSTEFNCHQIIVSLSLLPQVGVVVCVVVEESGTRPRFPWWI